MGNIKLNDEQRNDIILKIIIGKKLQEIAEEYEVHPQTIHLISKNVKDKNPLQVVKLKMIYKLMNTISEKLAHVEDLFPNNLNSNEQELFLKEFSRIETSVKNVKSKIT